MVCSDFEHVLAAIHVPNAPRIVTRALHKSTFAISEIRGDANHGGTDAIAYQHSYILQLRLQECQRCDYFLDGQVIEVQDRRAGVLQVHDLRLAPSADVLDPFHSLHVFLPQSLLTGVSDDICGKSFKHLLVEPGECFADDAIKHMLLSLRPSLARPQEANTLYVEHLANALCTHLVHRYAGLAMPPRLLRGGLAPWQAHRAKELIESDLSNDLTLTRLASECGLSVRHFSRGFTHTFGVPAHRYLTMRRVELAMRLLKLKHICIREVALECGFVDQSHFTRVFVSHIGTSPGNWRRVQGVA